MQDPKQGHAVARQHCGVAGTEQRARVKLGHGSRREAGPKCPIKGPTNWKLMMNRKKMIPRISRVCRCASQRSIQEKMARARMRLTRANVSRMNAVQTASEGSANATPHQIPNNHRLPRAVAISKAPYAT